MLENSEPSTLLKQQYITKEMKQEINAQLEEIFQKYSEGNGKLAEIAQRGYVWSDTTFSDSKKELDVLFVGLNPSYGNDGEKKYSFNPNDAGHRYFDSFPKLLGSIFPERKINWTHLDLLQMRQTSQKDVMSHVSSGVPFFVDQLRFSMNQMESLNPKLIVVCNTSAASFTGIEVERVNDKDQGVWMGYKFEFDEEFGVYEIKKDLHPATIGDKELIDNSKETKLSGVKVIFTSHLTYMSKYTRQTLAWQIKQVLKK